VTDQLRFVLDANVLIDAHRRYYSFDIAPCFWRVVLDLASEGHVMSIDRVKQELMNSDEEDALNKWANSDFNQWFLSTDSEEVFQAYSEVINWSVGQAQYFDYAKAEFAGIADSWLVAFAKAKDCIVVTHEQFSRDARKRILIPNACRAFGVDYMNIFEMLRRLNAKLGE
jgi:hypothetical protein